jgi:hypothetical protein
MTGRTGQNRNTKREKERETEGTALTYDRTSFRKNITV